MQKRKYSAEFKRETVKLANQSNITLSQLGKELGIRPNLISRWRQELSSSDHLAFKGSGYAKDNELSRLKRELSRVKKERDFLKEAATFFASQSR